jgi:hypothetical protein
MMTAGSRVRRWIGLLCSSCSPDITAGRVDTVVVYQIDRLRAGWIGFRLAAGDGGSQRTHCWRERDSNHRYLAQRPVLRPGEALDYGASCERKGGTYSVRR